MIAGLMNASRIFVLPCHVNMAKVIDGRSPSGTPQQLVVAVGAAEDVVAALAVDEIAGAGAREVVAVARAHHGVGGGDDGIRSPEVPISVGL